MVCAPVRSIIPSLKHGDYLSVQAHKPCSISHLADDIAHSFASVGENSLRVDPILKGTQKVTKVVSLNRKCGKTQRKLTFLR